MSLSMTTAVEGTLSLSPSLHSGMPLSIVLIFRAPTISLLTTVPLLFTRRFTLSTTSKNTSFFLYRMPSLLHETAFVTAIGGRAWTYTQSLRWHLQSLAKARYKPAQMLCHQHCYWDFWTRFSVLFAGTISEEQTTISSSGSWADLNTPQL